MKDDPSPAAASGIKRSYYKLSRIALLLSLIQSVNAGSCLMIYNK